MEDEKKNPSFPSNYVTLVQLQERWLKEKDRKQREEEEEQLRKLQQEREQKRKEEEEDRKASDRTIEADSKPSNRNGRMRDRRHRRDAPVKEVEVDGGERADQEGKSEGKKKKNKKKKGKKPNVAVEEEDVTGKEGVVSELPADIVKEDAPARRNGESRRHVVEFRVKMKNLPETAEIEAKLKNLSVKNGTEKVNDGLRKTKTQNHRGRGEIRDNRSRGLNLGDGRKRKDANWVWVKKGEAIDGNVTDNIPANSHFGTEG